MTVPRLKSLNKYWKKFPPVHVSAALYLGIGDGAKNPEGESLETFMEDVQGFEAAPTAGAAPMSFEDFKLMMEKQDRAKIAETNEET